MATPCVCIDCNQPGPIKLSCKSHFICGSCVVDRQNKEPGVNPLACRLSACRLEVAPPVSSCEELEQAVWIYVDDSNIWIEAKKLASKKKGFKTPEDHRVRIEIGVLTDVVAAGRRVAQGFLYGSEPPAIDSVWKKIQQKGWCVDKKKKSHKGKEKMVDAQLVADVTEKACTTPEEKRTTIILITGDADAIPAINKVLEYRGWKIEVYMWEHSMSSELKKLSKESNAKISYLDDVLSQVTFTNMKFNSEDKYLLRKMKAYGVVINLEQHAFPYHVPTKAWCDELESIAQWPFQYYWIEDTLECDTEDLVTVFKKDKSGEFDVTEFIESLREHPLPYMQSAKAYLEYSHEKSGQFRCAFNAVGRFSFDVSCEGSDNEALYVCDKATDPWVLVERKSKPRRRSQKYSDPCPYKCHCSKGINCFYKHTEEEKSFFHKNMGKGTPVRKVKPCLFHPHCKKLPQDCHYAHGESDAWCLMCKQYAGHFTENCHLRENSR